MTRIEHYNKCLDAIYLSLDTAIKTTLSHSELSSLRDELKALQSKVVRMKENGEKKCCICGKTLTGWGHNPYPVKTEGECCSECNMQSVVPARLERLRMLENSK